MRGIIRGLFSLAAVMVLAGGVAQASPQQASADASHAAVAAEPAAGESVPRLVQFNGTLKDAAARPVVGVASVTFAIYAEQDGGTALWSETQNVIADANGHFSALLGGATPGGMPAELFGTGQSRWLGITVARSAEMPRVLLASVPYALKAQDAETLGGLPASAYVTTQALAAANARATTPVISGGNTTILATPQVATASPEATMQGTMQATTQSATPSAIPQATPSGSGTTNYIPIWTSSSALGNSTIFESAGKVGIGTTTPAQTLDVNGNAIFRGSFQLPPQDAATASAGSQSHSFQFEASSYNSSKKAAQNLAFGFRAEPLGNNTSSPSAKLDLFYGPGGGTLTDTGLSFAANGIITFAPGQIFNGSIVATQELNFPFVNGGSATLINVGGYTFLNDAGSFSNLFAGIAAGSAATAGGSISYTTGVGSEALASFTSGTENTAMGASAMFELASGTGNTAIGADSLYVATNVSDITAVGYQSLENDVTGINNTAVGAASLQGATGNNNTAVGYDAGAETTGNDNTLIGVGADTSGGVSLSTAIGYGAKVGANNALVLGGTGQFAVNVGVGTAVPISEMDLESPAAAGPSTPSPVLTIGNTNGGLHSTTAIDFNPYAPGTGTYNPDGRFAFVDEGNYAGAFVWYNNVAGAKNNGLQQNMALDASGNLSIRGTLVKGGGSFKIDDPIDPANKYLSHSFVESPDMMNIYNGIVTLDAHGRAEVEMPEWFEALNRDFRYTLTAIGSPAPKIYVAEQMNGNHFKIAGGKKGQQISWMVTGIRQDAWANAHRIPTEEVKPAGEQGHYLHPELFGAGPEKAVSAAHVMAPAVTSAAPANAAVPGSK